MTLRNRLLTLLLASALLPCLLLRHCSAQSVVDIGESRHQVTVSEDQDDKIWDIELKYDDQIQDMRDTLRSNENRRRQLIFERDTALESILNNEQLKSLNEQRRAETAKALANAQKDAKAHAAFMVDFCKFLENGPISGEIVFFEGLPRATEEELKKIKEENKTIEVDGWSFYKTPLPIKPSIVEKLRSTMTNYRGFEPFSGGKFCGGFHPDFCVRWNSKGKTYHALICLTCFETAVISRDGKTVFDFNQATWKSFVQIAIASFAKHKDVAEALDEASGQ